MYKKGDIIIDIDSGILLIVVSVSEYDYNCTKNVHLYREGTYQFSIPKDCRTLKVGSVRGIK